MATSVWMIYGCVVAAMSAVTFAAYGWDKRQAIRGRWRVKEATLHGLALLGGWPGALLGRRAFSHKTRKVWFTVVLWAIVLAHLLGMIAMWRWGGAWF